MTERFRYLCLSLLAVTLFGACSSSTKPPPLLTDPVTSASTTRRVAAADTSATTQTNTNPTTSGTSSVETSAPAASNTVASDSTPPLAAATETSAEAAIRTDVIAAQQTYYDEVLRLPDTDVAKILDGSVEGSPLYQSTNQNLQKLKANKTLVRLAANPVNVIKVGKIRLLDKVTAEIELCLSNNLVLYRKRADGTEEIVDDTFGTQYTTEEWKFSDGRWKSVVLRKQQAQEGNQCDRLIP
jgi:hypothetical protein